MPQSSTLAGCSGSPAQAGMDLSRAIRRRGIKGLPRAGGDGPNVDIGAGSVATAPPRRRGWTLLARAKQVHRPGSPAQAGMDPAASSMGRAGERLPRAGGDGPGGEAGLRGLRGAPPRRRGWTPALGDLKPLGDGSPAQAGMDPRAAGPSPPRGRLPRAGGDGPAVCPAVGASRMAPPRRRGWTPTARPVPGPARGSPAQAGMDPHPRPVRGQRHGLPRAGGDGPLAHVRDLLDAGAPPRRRGWTRGREERGGGRWGSPAQAGMDPRPACSARAGPGLPRAGGDGPWAVEGLLFRHWAPPRRRGWTRSRHHGDVADGGSPAQAGMDRSGAVTSTRAPRLPRAGGDGPTVRTWEELAAGAPPRRRGWTRCGPRP